MGVLPHPLLPRISHSATQRRINYGPLLEKIPSLHRANPQHMLHPRSSAHLFHILINNRQSIIKCLRPTSGEEEAPPRSVRRLALESLHSDKLRGLAGRWRYNSATRMPYLNNHLNTFLGDRDRCNYRPHREDEAHDLDTGVRFSEAHGVRRLGTVRARSAKFTSNAAAQ